MSFTTVCAYLTGEPFRLSLAQVAQLTRYQVRAIYNHPRGEDSLPTPDRPAIRNEPYEDIFRKIWQARGLRDDQVEAKWQAYLIEQKDLKAKG